jgi:ABC-type nitrate/sulfonate/bicarbonate transport system permease component
VIARVARRVNVLGLLTLLGFFLLWELVVRTGIVEFEYIPAPSDVLRAGADLISSGILWDNLGHTLTATILGWLLASVAGILLGTLLGLVRPVWVYSMASIDALRSLPIVAFVPVAVLLLGFTLEMEVVVAFYAALWPVLLNTLAGMRSVNPRLIEVGRVLRLGGAREMWKLRLPAATPFIVTGMRLGLAISLVLTLVAEMVGNPAGVGFALISAAQSLQPETMFAYIVTISLSGIVLNALLVGIVAVLFRGQMAAAGETA